MKPRRAPRRRATTPPPAVRDGRTELFDFGPVAACLFDAAGCVVDVNFEAALLLDVDRERLFGKPLLSVVKLDYGQFWQHLRECFESGRRRELELSLTTRAGRELQVKLVSLVLSDPGSRRPLCHTQLLDVTAYRSNERGLKFLAELSDRLSAHLDVAGAMRDFAGALVPELADWALVSWGEAPAALSFTAQSRSPVEAGPAAEILPWLGRPRVTVAIERAMKQKVPTHLERLQSEDEPRVVRDRELEPQPRASQISALVLPLQANGRALGFVLLGRAEPYRPPDVLLAQEVAARAALALDHKRMYQEALRAIAIRDEFAAILSHDLVNSITSMKFAAESLMTALPAERRRAGRKQAERIEMTAVWSLRLVQNLLDIAQLEAGHMRTDPKREPVEPLVAEAVEMLLPSAAEKGISLHRDVAPGLEVLADKERVQQTLTNLISNAVKFSARGTKVEIRVERHPEGVQFCVADQGRGIPEDELPRIFDRFWQAKRVRRSGAGLGLAIAKGMVEAQGGRLWVTSRVGSGSRFFFVLPTPSPSAAG